VERILEDRIRQQIDIDDMQFGFMKGKGTTDLVQTWLWSEVTGSVPRSDQSSRCIQGKVQTSGSSTAVRTIAVGLPLRRRQCRQ